MWLDSTQNITADCPQVTHLATLKGPLYSWGKLLSSPKDSISPVLYYHTKILLLLLKIRNPLPGHLSFSKMLTVAAEEEDTVTPLAGQSKTMGEILPLLPWEWDSQLLLRCSDLSISLLGRTAELRKKEEKDFHPSQPAQPDLTSSTR